MSGQSYWIVVDNRTGKRAGVASWGSEERAQASIDQARENVEKGHRPDLADVIDYLEPVVRDA